MIINHNLMAMNANRQLKTNGFGTNKSIEKLSSGYRINRAGDDAAGLAISEKMRAQIKGLETASRNAQDSISLIQTAEGALNETHSILQRMRELSVQSANDTMVTTDRNQLQKEMDQLASELTRISTDTEFNTQKLLSGGFKDKKFHIGANKDQTIGLSIANMSASALGVKSATRSALAGADVAAISISTQAKAEASMEKIKKAIDTVSSERSKLGAVQNRLEHTINNLDTAAENLQASESRIRDTDMAKEMMQYTKLNILGQASTAMLAQANQKPQSVLQLLG